MCVYIYIYTYISLSLSIYIYIYTLYSDMIYYHTMVSLRGSSVKLGTVQRALVWPLRKDDVLSYYAVL